jgi:hypothetical protein
MPYEGEFATYRPLKRIVESERVEKLLGSFRVRERTDDAGMQEKIKIADVKPSDWSPRWVLAVDGSNAQVPVRNGYPMAEAAYVTVAAVLLNVAKMNELDQHRPVDPKEFRKTQEMQAVDCALPGCNVISEGSRSAKESLRKTMFDVFISERMGFDKESLLDTYEALLRYKPADDEQRPQKCPYEECEALGRAYQRGNNQYLCACPQAYMLYSTDALRVHEGMNPEGTNEKMFGEIRQVIERLWVVHVLRTFEAKGWLGMLSELAIVLDGPLAVFGHPAWLNKAIYQELSRINVLVRKATGGQDLLLVGVEKTGLFVQHFADVDRLDDGNSMFPLQIAGLLSDAYIKQHIVFSDSERMYGRNTYFGRKFFYKTKSGARLVASLPFLAEEHMDLRSAEPSQHPRLADAMALLDQLISTRFPNAVVPLIAANAEAAIPLHLGGKVLERLAKDLMAERKA